MPRVTQQVNIFTEIAAAERLESLHQTPGNQLLLMISHDDARNLAHQGLDLAEFGIAQLRQFHRDYPVSATSMTSSAGINSCRSSSLSTFRIIRNP